MTIIWQICCISKFGIFLFLLTNFNFHAAVFKILGPFDIVLLFLSHFLVVFRRQIKMTAVLMAWRYYRVIWRQHHKLLTSRTFFLNVLYILWVSFSLVKYSRSYIVRKGMDHPLGRRNQILEVLPNILLLSIKGNWKTAWHGIRKKRPNLVKYL